MMRAHTLVRPSEYVGETRRRSPRPNIGSCDFSRHAYPSRRQRVLHGQRPTASALPSGATSLSNGPWGVSPHGRTTRCHRVVRKQCTRRRRVARKSAYAQLPENIVPLDATGWHAHRALDATEWHGRTLRTRRPQPRASPAAYPRVCKDVWGRVTEPPSDAPSPRMRGRVSWWHHHPRIRGGIPFLRPSGSA